MLLIAPRQRPEKEIHYLNEFLLPKIKTFARFSSEQRAQLCRVMKYESYPKNAVILREGHRAENFYFIYAGQVAVSQLKEGLVNQRLHTLQAG
jgi:CRP-like cAMP-binding protein